MARFSWISSRAVHGSRGAKTGLTWTGLDLAMAKQQRLRVVVDAGHGAPELPRGAGAVFGEAVDPRQGRRAQGVGDMGQGFGPLSDAVQRAVLLVQAMGRLRDFARHAPHFGRAALHSLQGLGGIA